MPGVVQGLNRRGVLAGAGAIGLVSPASGQEAETEAALPAEVLALLPNLTTRLAVRTLIDGQGPFHFVIDTGANRTAIARSVATRLSLPLGPDVMVHAVTAAESTRTVLARRLVVSSFSYSDIHMAVFPDSRLGADGLLGLDILGNFQLTFNLPQRRLRLVRTPRMLNLDGRASRLRETSDIRAHRQVGQLLFSNVRAGQVEATAFVDSGSQHTIGNLALMRAIERDQAGGLGPRWPVPIIGVTGQQRMGQLAVVESISLGSTRLRRAAVIFADLHAFAYLGLNSAPALLLGADALGRIETVVVDFTRARVSFGRALG